MQLPAHSDAATAASAPVDSGGHDSGSSPPGTLRASPSGGKAPAASLSPSSPGSPSKSGGTPGGATREKPVKVLPCPRCESMNTKFCYYNNYSVTQPRHFCRQCQRYWTAGGTLRNVPVGGGSRKKSRHPRGGEPYLQRSGGNNNLPGAGNPNITAGPFGVPTQSVLQNVGHFQQMLSQETGFTQLNFAQLPGFAGYHPYAMDPVDLPPSMQHAMYGTAPGMQPGMQQPLPPYYHLQPHPDTTTPAPPFPTDTNTPGVKSEFWQHPSTMVAAAAAPLAQPNNNNNPGTKRFESSMLLNLGLNTRPPSSTPQPHPQSQMQSQQQQAHPQAAGAVTGAKNGSPPHGSSTIEEEGSTPTNGYSNSGYEEGDAVSSMWHSLHDMDNIFQ